MTETTSPKRIVILGGYGVFGGKLAQALLCDPEFDVVVAGRSLEKAKAFCARHGGTPARLDRMAPDFSASLALFSPFVTVDAAGPFQSYGNNAHAIAEAALASGSHYLDLSDDGAFTQGISALNERALSANRTILSGVSSVPALSSAAVNALKDDFSRLDLIESTILPGNRAPRGRSVIRAILAQAGRPLPLIRDSISQTVPGWSGLTREKLAPHSVAGLPPRWSCFIGAPDLILFPGHYGARTVLFRAGLELSLLHIGLWLLALPVRAGWLRSLEPAAGALQTVAQWLEPFGSDRGSMRVRVCGLDHDGHPHSRCWTLIAEAGDGPHVPAVAAAILCRRLSENAVAPGARPCLGEFGLDDVWIATRHLRVGTFQDTDAVPTLFQQALGSDFNALPKPVQGLHTVFDRRSWEGKAKITRGRSHLGNLICRIIGFPPQSDRTPVSVTIERRGDREIWSRNFGGKLFTSVLSPAGGNGAGMVRERFGPLSFEIPLKLRDKSLHFPVSRGWFLGLPLPHWLLPQSEATEFEEEGQFQFDVKISFPGLGLLVHYRGSLRQVREGEPQNTAAPLAEKAATNSGT